MNNEKNKLPIILMITVGIILIVCAIFLMINDKDNKEKKTQDVNKQINDNNDINNKKKEDITVTLDFNKMEQDLILLANNNVPKIAICQDDGNEETGPHAEYSFNEISNESIKTIVNKLKEAIYYEETTYEFLSCPNNNISYIIGESEYDNSFNIKYADDDKILLVGYDGKEYAFTFNSANAIERFIESLK